MSFSASLYRVYSDVIRYAGSYESPKDVYSSNLDPNAFQYHNIDASYVADLKVLLHASQRDLV